MTTLDPIALEAARVLPIGSERHEVIAAYLAVLSQPQAGEPTGYIDKHRQKFANIEMHDAETLAKGGWTPVYLASPQPALAVKGLQDAWSDFCDANPDGLTSPEDLPDHALMTCQQFVDYALSALASPPSDEHAERAGLHGPYGWLNGHRALSEDSWTLEIDPTENSEEEFAIPLYALVDPFKEIGKDFDGKAALVDSRPPSGEVEADGRFLLDRLDEYIADVVSDTDFSQWNGHVAPAIARFRTALSRAPATADGWRLVPVDPTDAMTDAASDASEGFHGIDGDKGPWLRSEGFAAAYRAMIAAAPTATGGR